ncbi:MAG: type II toxin-antitoxin system VapC family toxin [Methanobrevibacter sp.]|nr:type II toxin-antitoxin system VapC family toxin [Methanobrevibacter sp.]
MIFLDTTYINGLILKNDVHSKLSKSIEPFLEKESKITNVTVLVEVLNSVNRYNFFGNVDDLRNYLLNMNVFDFLTVDDYQKAFGLFKYYNKSINYADCTILQSMQNHGITKIVSFDSDFDKIKGIQRIVGF